MTAAPGYPACGKTLKLFIQKMSENKVWGLTYKHTQNKTFELQTFTPNWAKPQFKVLVVTFSLFYEITSVI